MKINCKVVIVRNLSWRHPLFYQGLKLKWLGAVYLVTYNLIYNLYSCYYSLIFRMIRAVTCYAPFFNPMDGITGKKLFCRKQTDIYYSSKLSSWNAGCHHTKQSQKMIGTIHSWRRYVIFDCFLILLTLISV